MPVCSSSATWRWCRPSTSSRPSSTTRSRTAGSPRPTPSVTCTRWADGRSRHSRSRRFPPRISPPEIVKAIFAGGLSVLQECGVALLGGHTVQDLEVKFGYAVTGLVAPDAVWTNAGARAGDVLILTKALGTGVIATAAKFGRTDAGVLAGAMASMQSTNRAAAEALRGLRGAVHGCTDVTGFGLAGHACEMATASGVAFEIDVAARAPAARRAGPRPRQSHRRTGEQPRPFRRRRGRGRRAAPTSWRWPSIPQTSGGLLASVDADVGRDRHWRPWRRRRAARTSWVAWLPRRGPTARLPSLTRRASSPAAPPRASIGTPEHRMRARRAARVCPGGAGQVRDAAVDAAQLGGRAPAGYDADSPSVLHAFFR